MISIDSFARHTKQHNPKDLLWASNTRGNLKVNPPPFQLALLDDGTICIEKVMTKFQLSTGIQEGYQLLQLQGKDVCEYHGGINAIRKVLEESRRIELIALKPSAIERKCNKDVPVEKKMKKNKKKQRGPRARSETTESSNVSSRPKKEKKRLDETTTSKRDHEMRKKHNDRDLLRGCGTKRSVQQNARNPETRRRCRKKNHLHTKKRPSGSNKRSVPRSTITTTTCRSTTVSASARRSSTTKPFSFSSFSSSENSSQPTPILGRSKLGWLKSKLLQTKRVSTE